MKLGERRRSLTGRGGQCQDGGDGRGAYAFRRGWLVWAMSDDDVRGVESFLRGAVPSYCKL